MIRNISIWGVVLGLLISQAVGYVLAIVLVIGLLFVYKSSMLVAFFEYPVVIALTMLISLLAIACGGYGTMLTKKKHYASSVVYGLLSIALNLGFLYLIDSKYALGSEWILVVAGILVVPSALLGAYLYQKRNV